jgi:hypothetical protein
MREADNRFIDRFPKRLHRIRLASRAECKHFKILGGRALLPSEGERVFVVLRYFTDQRKWVRFYVICEAFDCDIEPYEADAAHLFESLGRFYAELVERNWMRKINQ